MPDANPKKVRAIEGVMASFGMGGTLTYNDHQEFLRRLVNVITPTHEICSAAWLLDQPPETLADRLCLVIAQAIEAAAVDARDDRTHIDPAGRAARIVRAFGEDFEAALLALSQPGEGRTRTQAILAKRKKR